MTLLERIKNALISDPLKPEEKPVTCNGNTRLAVPSMLPGGIDALRSGHFGRCDCFTLVDIEQGKVKDVEIVPNPPHLQGECLAPVGLLKLHGANAIIVSGIGMRPLTGFRAAGMEVYIGKGDSVSDVILDFIIEALTPMSAQEACGGH